MAIAFVRNLNANPFPFSSTTGMVLASGEFVPSGYFLIAHVAADNGAGSGAASTLTVNDSAGNTWTVQGPVNRTAGSVNNDGTACYITYSYINNALSSSDSINFVFGNNVLVRQIKIDVFSGINNTTPVAVAYSSTTGSNATPTALGVTPTAAGQLVYGALAIEGPLSDGYTEDTDTVQGSWVSLTATGGGNATPDLNQTTRAVYKISSGTTAQSWQPSLGTARDRASMLMIFAAQPAPSGNNRMFATF